MKIVAATPADATWLAALHARCFPDEPWDAQAWATLLAQPGVGGSAAMAAGIPVGFALMRHAADEAEILSIGVLPAYRRAGVARRLLEGAIAGLPAAVGTVFLEVAVDNIAARALYEAVGFQTIGRRPAYYRRGGRTADALMLSLVRANALSDKRKSDADPGRHGRQTPKWV